MATRALILRPGYFPLFDKGKPIANGFIYIGEPDLDPEIPANQKAITFLQEDGSQVAGSQPVRTSAGGVPTYNGSPVTVLIDGDYSVKVLDKKGAQVYYIPRNSDLQDSGIVTSVANVVDLRALTGLADGQVLELVSYRDGWAATLGGPKGGGTFTVDLSDLATPDDGGFCFVTAEGVRIKRNDLSRPTPEMWGAYADGANADSAAILRAVTFLKDVTQDISGAVAVAGHTLYFDTAVYYVPTAISIDNATGARRISLAGSKTIMLGDGSDDCFVYDGTYRNKVVGFEFQNFVNAVELDTNNIAGATFTLEECAAFNCERLIDTVSYSQSRSTVLNINQCYVDRSCTGAVRSFCDVTNINGGNFQHNSPGTALFVLDSRATFNGCLMTPYQAASDSRWIDFYDDNDAARWLTLNQVRFGGEFAGITAVYNFAQGRSASQTGNGITFNGGYVSSGAGGPSGNGSIVVLADDGATATICPNKIEFNDCNTNIGSSSKLVKSELGNPLTVAGQLGFSVHVDQSTRKNVLDKTRYMDDLVKPYIASDSRGGYQNITTTGNIDIDSTLGDVINIQVGSTTTVQNILYPVEGMRITFCNQAGSTNAVIEDNSTAGNGIYVGGSDYTIPAQTAITLAYTSLNGRWVRVIS